MTCGGIFNKYFAANLWRITSVKKNLKIGWELTELPLWFSVSFFGTQCSMRQTDQEDWYTCRRTMTSDTEMFIIIIIISYYNVFYDV